VQRGDEAADVALEASPRRALAGERGEQLRVAS
jgi:hypothetical protein